MSAKKFQADLEAANRKALVVQKLAEIIEWRIGKTHNNQALVNDIVTSGLLDNATVVDFSIFNELCLSRQGMQFVADVLRKNGIAVK